MRWAGYIAGMGNVRNAYKILVGKPEGNKPLGRPRCRWDDNIRIDLRRKQGVKLLTGCIWFTIGTSGGLL
jgi:hypothetical protein